MKTETKIIIGVFLTTVIAVVGGALFLSKNSGQISAAKANIGSPAPNFTLPATTDQNISLSDFKDKKNVLIYFHEGLTCDPCMQQVPELEKTLDEFDKMNVAVLAVSGVDSIDQLKQSLDRLSIKKIPLISYATANTEIDYDLTRFSMGMGKRAGHTFVLVGTDGTIKWRKDYWPGLGHMVAGGTMFVNPSEIVNEVKKTLNR